MKCDRGRRLILSYDPKAPLDSLLAVFWIELPEFPEELGEASMPAGIPVILPPIVKFFHSLCGRCLVYGDFCSVPLCHAR